MTEQRTILVAPLNWGLGHATRCIPIIKALLDHSFGVILASDGAALALLRKEFPNLQALELPSYDIRYSKRASNFNLKVFLKLPHIQKTILSEKKIVEKFISEENIHGIISDNRLGVRSKKIPSVYITHQLKVITGKTTFITSKFHQKFIQKFDECWVPDVESSANLSGKLGHLKTAKFRIKYIGLLSRMQQEKRPIKYDILGLLSGPEPQRTMLEDKLIKTFKGCPERVLIVQGVVEEEQQKSTLDNIELVNYMQTKELEQAINESELVVSRSGYTTIMDLAIMQKKAFFIPTPGQGEQVYLAKRLQRLGLVPSAKQVDFELKHLNRVKKARGFEDYSAKNNFTDLFALFEGK